MKKAFYLNCALLLSVLFGVTSCNKTDNTGVIGCDMVLSPVVLPVNIVDAVSGQDLFFASSPKYKTNSLYFFSIKDKNRKDTIRATIVETGTTKVFTVRVNNTVTKDTLLMKIATNPDDVIIYTIKKADDACGSLILDQVLYNGNPIISNQARYVLMK